jgi:hypothetical protein
MQAIVSGSTTERVVRTSIVTVLAVFASAYCFYDGYIGYPRENLKRAVSELSPQPPSTPQIAAGLTSKSAGEVDRGWSLTDLVARWGDPGWRQNNEARFFGPGGQLVVTLVNDRVIKSEYQEAKYKTEFDLLVQKIMGCAVGAAALVLLVHWFRVMFARTRMTEEGIKTSGRPWVPFDAITGLRSERFAKKGWVDVEYALNGRTGTLRLDDYKIKAFPAIMQEICRRKGFEDPYKKWIAEKAGAAPADSTSTEA